LGLLGFKVSLWVRVSVVKARVKYLDRSPRGGSSRPSSSGTWLKKVFCPLDIATTEQSQNEEKQMKKKQNKHKTNNRAKQNKNIMHYGYSRPTYRDLEHTSRWKYHHP
jgi:hypothetical protein